MAGRDGMPLNNGDYQVVLNRAYVGEHKGAPSLHTLFQYTDINKPMPLTCGKLDTSKAFI